MSVLFIWRPVANFDVHTFESAPDVFTQRSSGVSVTHACTHTHSGKCFVCTLVFFPQSGCSACCCPVCRLFLHSFFCSSSITMIEWPKCFWVLDFLSASGKWKMGECVCADGAQCHVIDCVWVINGVYVSWDGKFLNNINDSHIRSVYSALSATAVAGMGLPHSFIQQTWVKINGSKWRLLKHFMIA